MLIIFRFQWIQTSFKPQVNSSFEWMRKRFHKLQKCVVLSDLRNSDDSSTYHLQYMWYSYIGLRSSSILYFHIELLVSKLRFILRSTGTLNCFFPTFSWIFLPQEFSVKSNASV
jgi:hypothetical protein